VQHLDGGVAAEGLLAGEKFVEYCSEAENVRRCRHFGRFSRGLLRGHIGRGADYFTSKGKVTPKLKVFGQSEVADVRLVFAIDEDVGGLQVAMEDPMLMSIVNRSGDPRDKFHVALNRVAIRNKGRNASPFQAIRQSLAFDQLHAEVILTCFLAGLEDRNDIRMGETGGGLGFRMEALDRARGDRMDAGDDFKRDGAAKARLSRLVDNAHSATPEFLKNFVVAKITHPFRWRVEVRTPRCNWRLRRANETGDADGTLSAKDGFAQFRIALRALCGRDFDLSGLGDGHVWVVSSS
jgi:hypothetical protein